MRALWSDRQTVRITCFKNLNVSGALLTKRKLATTITDTFAELIRKHFRSVSVSVVFSLIGLEEVEIDTLFVEFWDEGIRFDIGNEIHSEQLRTGIGIGKFSRNSVLRRHSVGY